MQIIGMEWISNRALVVHGGTEIVSIRNIIVFKFCSDLLSPTDVTLECHSSVYLSALSSFFLHPGIISMIAFSPSHLGMFATGSYSQTTAIYEEGNMEPLYILHGQEGGVTHVSGS